MQLVLCDLSNNTGATDVKIDGSALKKNSSFKIVGAKTASMKIEALIRSMKFFLLRLLCISMNPSYAHAWNTFVMSGLVPLIATWNC